MKWRWWAVGLAVLYGTVGIVLVAFGSSRGPATQLLDDAVVVTLAGVTAVLLRERSRHAEDGRVANSRLTERAQQLEAAVKELEAFSYTVSHDLRAPMRHIGGYARLLDAECGDRLTDEGRRYLGTIVEAVKRTGALVDDLLAFSRIGRTAPRRGAVDLAALVDEAIRRNTSELHGRRIDWVCHALPTIVGDGAMLRVAVDSLIANAIKYTRPRDAARIEIGCCDESGADVVFYVRDNGVGFDMRYAGKLFGVFQRLHHPDTFEGNGIGLASVSRIAERHGGAVWAEARPDEGATFFVRLPRESRAIASVDRAAVGVEGS